MRISKYSKPVGFIIFLMCVNLILCFFLEPMEGGSVGMWNAYEQETEIDTLFVGASVTAATFDPLLINEEWGIQSFNMGTPSQAIRQTLSGVKKASGEHEIKTVIYGMDFFVFQQAPLQNAVLTFENIKARKGNWLYEGLQYICLEDVWATEASINYWFPWVYNKISISQETFSDNVKKKLQLFIGNMAVEEYNQKGYSPYSGQDSCEDMWGLNSYYTYSQSFLDEEIKAFRELMEFCDESQIKLIVINVPNPVYDAVSCVDTYAENDEKVRALCNEYGVEYFDFSLVKPELFELKPEFFYNFEHLNYQGSQEFSKMFGKFMKEWETKGDMTEYFYGVEEFYELHDDMVQEWKRIQCSI